MAVDTANWAEYDRWNDAIALTFYPESSEGRPVYLDLDEDQFPGLAAMAGCKSDDAPDAMASAVRGVLNLHIDEPAIFGPLLRRAGLWYGSWRRTSPAERLSHEPPPVLALLALLSRAADLMGADAKLAPHDYYGRLTQLLGIKTPKARERLIAQYRQHGEALWKLLEVWLTGLEGLRGLPSAFAVSHRYVGLPMSQALVRGHDRAKMSAVFADLGLAPGQQMSAEEMERLLDPYLTRDDSPLSRTLCRLWARDAARERIASVAAVELEAWEGLSEEGVAGASYGEARVALLQRTFPVPSIETTLFVRRPGAAAGVQFTLLSAESQQKPDVSFALISGWLRPVQAGGIDVASLLEGVLVLADAQQRQIRRLPRRVVPLRWDESAGAFIEVERVTLTEDAVILSHVEAATAVASALTNIARDGWARVDDRRGLPAGWVLFTGVQILGVLPTGGHVDLNVLIPHVRSQVSLGGGLRLPGGLRKFSSLAPPEIRYTLEAADRVRFQLLRSTSWDHEDTGLEASYGPVLDETLHSAAGVVPLTSLGLSDGDYEILVQPQPEGRVQTYQLRLRSGDTVDGIMWSRSPRLVYELGAQAGWGAMSARELPEDCAVGVDGAASYGEPPDPPAPADVTADPWWSNAPARDPSPRPTLRLAQPDPQSCVNTGRHRILLPTFYGKRTANKTIEGHCEGCGLVKRYPTYLPRYGKKTGSPQRTFQLVIADVPPVQPGDLSWDTAFDAVMHAGGGPISALERIALQVQAEASSLFVDQFQRTLQILGHIDITRDPVTFRPLNWEVTPSALAQLGDGSFQLIGYWPAGLRRALTGVVVGCGGQVLAVPQAEAPTRYRVLGCDGERLEALIQELEISATISHDAGRGILRRLPPLSAVEAALPRSSLPGGKAMRFDVTSARWTEVPDASSPGSYRMQSFSTWDVVRRQDDIAQGTARIATVQLSKHLEGLREARCLVAYRPEERLLLVPLGADLPGLYGRAAVLLSGKLPEAVPSRRTLAYQDVPADFAATLAALLQS